METTLSIIRKSINITIPHPCSTIWCNSNFSLHNETFIFKDWFDKGIRNIFDIVDINGHLYNFEELQRTYSLKGTFLDYQRLIRKIPKIWLETINDHNDKCKILKYNVQINLYLKLFLKTKGDVEHYMIN